MGNKKSRPSMPTNDNNHDVTEAISKSVGRMIARAAANKNVGKEFDIDLKQCENFIKHQIELVPPTVSSKPDDNEIYCHISIVRKGIPRPIHIPLSHTSITDHTAKGTSSRETARAQGTQEGRVGNSQKISPEAQVGIGVGAAAGGMVAGAAVEAVAGMFVPFVGGVIGSIAGSLASGGIRKRAEGVHLVLDSIILTAEDIIFKERDSANKIIEKGHYIHCIINEVDSDNADINRN